MEIEWHAPIPFLEHKSLESTINDFDENAFRPPIDDFGKGILDQRRREKVDADESPNNINFSQQLASTECTADGKLTAPQNKFKLSAFTEQSKLFSNDFTAPSIGDNSGRIDVNFSAIQQIGKDEYEIENDLERVSSNMGCEGPFSYGQNVTEHIEEELNMTQTIDKNDEDMFIKNTVHSSLQDVSKSAPTEMKVSLNKDDLVADKENIASNPYALAPCEFGEEPKQVVVFDVERSTLLPDMLEEDKDYRQTLLHHSPADIPHSFISDVNDDLSKPNHGMLNSKCRNSRLSGSRARKKNKRHGNEIPDTVPVHKVVITPKYEKASKRETIVFNDGACNMCVTQALPVNIMQPDKQTKQKCQTVKYENDSGNFSDTQKFDTDNISVTQAIPSNILLEKVQLDDNKDNNEAENIIITQSFSNNNVAIDSKTSRHRTIVYKNGTGNISITQVKQQLKPGYSEEKPIVHLSTFSKPRSKKTNTIVNDNDKNHIFMTESVSANIIAESKNKTKSIVYDEDLASISMSLAITANNYLLDGLDAAVDIKKTEEIKEVNEKVTDDEIIEEATNKIKNIACDQVDRHECDISTNIIGESTNEINTIAHDVDSKSLVISTNVYLLDKLDSAADITKPIINYQVIDYDVFEQDNLKPTEDTLQDNRKSTVFVANKFDSEPSMTMGMINDETESLYTTKTKLSNLTKQNLAANPPSNIIVLQAITTNREQLTASISEQINLMDPLYRVPTYVRVQKANNWKVATPNTQKVLSLPVIPVSATVVPVHPRGIDKLQVKLITSTTNRTIETVFEDDDDSVKKESLSNISYQSLQRGTYDKSLMASLESDPSSAVIPHDTADSTSTESMFYIMKDSEFVTQTDRKMKNKAKKANPKDEEEQVVHLQRQLSELKTAIQNSALPSKSFEIDKRNEHVNIEQQASDNFSRLSDTQDLLDLISDFTGSVACEDNVRPVTIKVEDQGGTIDHKRVSVAHNRQSKILDSREGFLRNILSQNSFTCEEKVFPLKKTPIASLTCEEKIAPLKKTAVATLTCEEKFSTLNNTAVATFTCEEKFSPLKKTAFGETSYMYETKEKVIPTHFKDVSDRIKELMLDLVKPMSNDNIQIRLIDRNKTKNTSTHSAQIQADLATSSQDAPVLIFDHLNPLNNVQLASNYSKDGHNPSQTDEKRCGSGILLKKISKGNNYEAETFTTTQFTMMPEPSTMQDDIRVYQKDYRFSKKDDQFSSLSTTSGSISVDPSADAISGKLLKKISKDNNYESETFTTAQFTMMPKSSIIKDDMYVYQKDDRFSIKDNQFSSLSTTSGSISVDQSADTISKDLRNEKVKSIMEMRKNEELFGVSLSLELVGDASQDANRILTSDSKHKNLKLKFSISPHVNIQGEAAKIVKAATLSGISIRQRFNSSNSRVSVTNKTRIDCSPSAGKHELTPKPITEISKSSKPQKVSAVLSSPDDPTKSLRTEEMFFIFVDQSFRAADPVFDRLTPVNNILHSPTDSSDAHKNDPRKTDQTLFGSASSFNNMSKGDYEDEEALTTTQNTMVPGQHTDNTLTNLLNTIHALVNDESGRENRVLAPDSEHSNHSINSSRSVLVDSEGQATGRYQYYRTKSRGNGKKQICIPSPSMKVTQKPIAKIQEISTNPKPRIEPSTEFYSADDFTHNMASEKDVSKTNNRDAHSSTICEKKSLGPKETSVVFVHKPCTSVVLDFDMLNPLNNILLAPTYNMEVHKYNPRHTHETLRDSGSPFKKGNDNEVETVTTTLYTRTPEPKKKKKKRNIYLRK